MRVTIYYTCDPNCPENGVRIYHRPAEFYNGMREIMESRIRTWSPEEQVEIRKRIENGTIKEAWGLLCTIENGARGENLVWGKTAYLAGVDTFDVAIEGMIAQYRLTVTFANGRPTCVLDGGNKEDTINLAVDISRHVPDVTSVKMKNLKTGATNVIFDSEPDQENKSK